MAVTEAVRWEPVAWCAGCEWYLPVEEAGTRCPGDECKRILQRRVGRICYDCDEQPIFLNPNGDGLDKHRRAVHG